MPPFFLVFDNYHEVPLSSPFHDVFKEGLSKVSPDIQVIVLSRADPPSALSGMMANNRMRIIGWHDLRLNLDETKEIMWIEITKKLSKKIIERIHKKVER